MNFKSFFNNPIFLSILAFLMIVVMIKLGFWQLDRSEFKAQRQMRINERSNQDIRELPSDLLSAKQWSYFRVNVSGQYLPDQGFLVDNIVNDTLTGVSVVTPLKINGSETLILVDRGWLTWGPDRTFLPKFDTPNEVVKLTGLLVPAAQGHFYLKKPDESKEPGELWLQLDLEKFKQATKNPVQPMVFILDDNQPGSYKHIWNNQDDNWIERHKAYAVQWFALAFTLFLLSVIMNYKSWNKRKNHG